MTPSGTIFGQSDSGLDTVTRVFKTNDTVEAARDAAPARFTPDDDIATMFLTKVYAKESGASATEIEYVFSGALDEAVYTPRRVHGKSLQTASYNDGEQQLEILYRSPHTTTRWIATSDDMTYSGYSGPDSPKILARRIDGHIPIVFRYADAIRQSAAYGAATDAQRDRIDAWLASNAAAIDAAKARIVDFFNRSFATEEDTEFEAKEIIPGEYWDCSATTRVLLVPI